jgi:serine/threonine protein kinase
MPKSFSKELKSLLHGMLDTKEAGRLTAAKAMQHAFFHDMSFPEESTQSAI